MLTAFFPFPLAQSGGNILTYFGYSNTAGQVIVFTLLILSLTAWTIMIGKYLDLANLRQLNIGFERRVQDTPRLVDVDLGKRAALLGPYAALLHASLVALRNNPHDSATALRVSHVENALQRAVARRTIQYESKMVLLGSIVSGAPFLGLLGTVWGVMDAFGSMAAQSTASLQALAPGVSGALLTTVMALLVAIPSVFGYNFLLAKTKMLITELENFASAVADRIERELEAGESLVAEPLEDDYA